MPTGNPTHLLKLADREFKALTEERPTPQPSRKFKPMKLNVARFDQAWDRKRGAAARLTAVFCAKMTSRLSGASVRAIERSRLTRALRTGSSASLLNCAKSQSCSTPLAVASRQSWVGANPGEPAPP